LILALHAVNVTTIRHTVPNLAGSLPGWGAEMAEVAQVADTATVTDEDVVIEELLVEEVSIDGMCGVY
jgi:mycofactocin precursor